MGQWKHIADLIGGTGAQGPQGAPGETAPWKPNTPYLANQLVIAPNGDPVRAKVAFTSGAAYSASNWNASTQDSRIGTVEGVASQAVGLAVQALPRWKANTPYSAGQQVVAPDGDVVSAKVAFTSAATYSAANWNPSGLSVTIDYRGLPQRELVTGEDINNIRDPGLYTCPSTTVAATLLNWPAGSFTGSLLVGKAKAGNFTSQDVSALVSSTAPPEHVLPRHEGQHQQLMDELGLQGLAPRPDAGRNEPEHLP